MGSECPRRALLLGLVEVRQPLEHLDEKGRARMFSLCHTASVAGHVDDSGWLGWQERGLMGVEVVLDQEHLYVTSNDVLVSRYSLTEVSAITTIQGTEGHLLVVGHCQVKALPLAVVLDMMSQVDARQLEEDILQRLPRLLPSSIQPSASEDTICPTQPSAPSLTELDSFSAFLHTSSRSVSQHRDQLPVHSAVSPGPIRTQPSSSVAQSSSCSIELPNPLPLPVKTILPGPLRTKPPVAKIPTACTLLATPLRYTFPPPISRVPISQACTPTVSTLPVSTPVSTAPISTPLVSLRPVSTRAVSTRPVSTPLAHTRPVSSPQLFPRPATTRPVSTMLVPTPPVSASAASTPPVYTDSVSVRPVSNRVVSTRPESTPLASTLLLSTRHTSTTTVPTPPVSTRSLSKPMLPTRPVSNLTMSSRSVSLSKISTPLVSTVPVSNISAPIPTLSSSSVSTPNVPTRPVSLLRVRTPLAFIPIVSSTTVSVTPVYPPSVSTPPTFPRPVSKPVVSTRPAFSRMASSSPVSTTTVSTATASTPTLSTTNASNLVVSNTPEPATPLSTITVSMTPVSTSPVSTTPVFTPSVSDQSTSDVIESTSLGTAKSASTLPISSPPVSTEPVVSEDLRRHSVASSSSLEQDISNVSDKMQLILGTLNVEESEYLFIPSLKHTREQDSSSSLEHELSTLLESELQYLDTLRRIKDARKVVKSELQNLLRRSESLVDFHEQLYRGLNQEFPSCSGFVQVFLSRKEDLEQYRYYLMNAPQVVRQLSQQTEEVKRQHPTLEADLKSSWKRLHYYFMTFDKIAEIVSAEEKLLVQELVDLLRDMNRQGDLAILIDGVSEAPFNLHTLGTLFLHGLFSIKDSSGILKTKAKHHVLLFEEMIVITLPKKERYQYKDHLPIRQLHLRQGNGKEATFVLDFVQGGNKKNRRFTFKSRQQEVADTWQKEITRLHLEYAKRVKYHSKLRYGCQ